MYGKTGWGMQLPSEAPHPANACMNVICPQSPSSEETNRFGSQAYYPVITFSSGRCVEIAPNPLKDLVDLYTSAIKSSMNEEQLLVNLLKNPLIARRLPYLEQVQITQLSDLLRRELQHFDENHALLLKGYIYLSFSIAQGTFSEFERLRWVPSLAPYMQRFDMEASPLLKLLLNDSFLFEQFQKHLSKVAPIALAKIVPYAPALACECALLAMSKAREDPQMLDLFRESLRILNHTNKLRESFVNLWRGVREMTPFRAFQLTKEIEHNEWDSDEYNQFREYFITLYDYLLPYDGPSLIGSLARHPERREQANQVGGSFLLNLLTPDGDSLALEHALLHHVWLAPLLRQRTLCQNMRFSFGTKPETNLLLALEVLMRIYRFDPNLDISLRPSLARWIHEAALLRSSNQSSDANTRMKAVFGLLVAEGLRACLDIWLSQLDSTLLTQLMPEQEQLRDWRLLAVYMRHLSRSNVKRDEIGPVFSSELLNYIVLGAKLKASGNPKRKNMVILCLPAGSFNLDPVSQWTLARALLFVHMGLPFWTTPSSPFLISGLAEQPGAWGPKLASALRALTASHLASRFGNNAKLGIEFQTRNDQKTYRN